MGIGMTSAKTRQRLVQRLREKGIQDPRVLKAIEQVPRHRFVDEALSSRAYEDSALPIGRGQTISQPYIVALMTQSILGQERPKRVLEIGTGSGYQAAILAQVTERVFTTERIGELLRTARQRFHELGIHNVLTRHVDGLAGWPGQAPFDAIVVTAGGEIPALLLDQLADGGILVAPQQRGGRQELIRVTRYGGEYQRTTLGEVSFVPLRPGVE
ncbi:MAG: protein-L-isoaspartate(D-aspartate) O-methyltransferase [Wenzhouxiangella sp.]|jgi:protein-L-isoaspartate(D-aspartate) O-methyltransferase|nr:protein-L-isoaspartate(D-aspartate) O-methyltransferase [Wenzhouxiangella sp.]